MTEIEGSTLLAAIPSLNPDIIIGIAAALCCSYPAVAMVNTNMVANRGISTVVAFTSSIETINPSSSSQYFQQL